MVPLRQEDEEADRRAGDDARGAVRDEGGEEAQAHAALPAGGVEHALAPGGAAEGEGDKAKAKAKPTYVVFGVPKKTVVISCGTDAVACPGVNATPTSRTWYLFKYDPDNPNGPSRSHRQGPEALRHARRPRPEPRPRRADAVHGQGQRQVPGDHVAASTGAATCSARRSTSRSSSTARSSRSRRSTRTTAPCRTASAATRRSRASARFAEAKNLALVLQTGSLPYQFTTLESTNVSATLGKDSLAAGEARGDRRPHRGRDLPAPPLPLHGRRRGARPRDLRRAPLRRDPAPQRDADAAGLRGTDPHDRRRRGRERRRLRTHQGRGAGREVRARRDRRRVREGLPHDPRRERRHARSPRSCSSRSRPRASRASR